MGEALKAYFCGNKKAQLTIHSSIDGLDKMPIAHFFRTFLEMPKIEQLALMLCRGKVLDVGAGSGCHALILQEKKFHVYSLDVSQGAAEIMIARGLEKVICSTIFDYHPSTKFDTLLFMMNGIGVGGDIEGVEKLLLHCKKLLAPKGQIIFDSSNIYNALANDQGVVYFDLSAEYYGTVRYQLEFDIYKTPPFYWTYLDMEKLKAIAEKTGYEFELLLEGNNNDYLGRLILEN